MTVHGSPPLPAKAVALGMEMRKLWRTTSRGRGWRWHQPDDPDPPDTQATVLRRARTSRRQRRRRVRPRLACAPRRLPRLPRRGLRRALQSLPGGAPRADPGYQAFTLLRITFTVAPIAFGLDKFFTSFLDWETYLAPWIIRLMPGSHDIALRDFGLLLAARLDALHAWQCYDPALRVRR